MTTQTTIKNRGDDGELELRAKAAILNELMELIEEKLLGYLMKATEKGKNIPLSKAKKILG